MSENKRIEWVDTAKGIGIILMIFGHISLEYGQIHIKQVISAFHMPLFFMLAGLFVPEFFNKNSFIIFLKKKVTAVIVPYILWVLILADGLSLNNLLLMAYGSEAAIETMHINGALWFLPCLFVSFVIVAILFWMIDRLSGGKRKALHYLGGSGLCAILGGY